MVSTSLKVLFVAPSSKAVNQTAFLPVVVIKDPFTWMEAMCRHQYAASWRRPDKEHCPNLVPTTPEEIELLKDRKTFKVDIEYFPTNITHHESLADLWNEWYGNWIDASFPRLIVRFEDLLFHAELVVGKVCECAGGKFFDGPFQYIQDSAKKGSAHKGSNGLVKAIMKYGDKATRIKKYHPKDLQYSKHNLQSEIMTMFRYSQIP